jgi:tyrosine-protein kinase Etk/Wzc
MKLLEENLSSSEINREGTVDLSFLALLIALAAKKDFIAKFVTTATLITTMAAFLLPSWYTATTVILPPSQNSSLSGALLSQLGNLSSLTSSAGGSSLAIKNPNDQFAAMLRSRTVEDAMIARFDLRREYGKRRVSDARDKFEKHSTVEVGAKDGLIRISVEAKDPTKAAAMANAYVEQFRNLTSGLAITEASQRRVFFEHQLIDAKNSLATAEEDLKRTQQSTGILQLDSDARALIATSAALRAQVTAKEVQIRAMRSYAAENNPELNLQKQQLAELQDQLRKLGGETQSTEADPLLPRKAVSQAGVEYVRKLREVKYYDAIFALLAHQLELAKLDEARQGSLVQIVDPAVTPDRRSFPLRAVWIGSAFIASLILACFWAIATTLLGSGSEPQQAANEKWDTFCQLLGARSARQ